MKIFSVLDRAADAFLPPFTAANEGVAIRMVQDALEDENHQLSRHTRDFSLHLLGEFDEVTGEIQSRVEKILECIQLVRSKVRERGTEVVDTVFPDGKDEADVRDGQ